jgi:hypothetical protein
MDIYDQVELDYLSQDYKEMAKSHKYKNDFKLEDEFERNAERLKKMKIKEIILDDSDDWDEDRMDIIGQNGPIGYKLEEE